MPGGGVRTRVAQAIASSPTAASTPKLARIPTASSSGPGSPPSTRDPATRLITAMDSAVPAAPATCCSEPRMAEPWEYRWLGSDPRPAVKSGVKVIASASDRQTCSTRISQASATGASSASRPSMRVIATVPGSTSRGAPYRS